MGSYRFDNTQPVRGNFARLTRMLDRFVGTVGIPVEDDPAAIRRALWYETDRQYKSAVQQLASARTNVRVAITAEDTSGDYSAAPAGALREPVVPLQLDRPAWEKGFGRTRRHSRASAISMAPTRRSRRRSRRAGTSTAKARRSRCRSRVSPVHLRVLESGRRHGAAALRDWFSSTAAGLPPDDVVLKKVETMIKDLHALRTAPVVDPYSGPAILSGPAAAVFFHEIFGHRVEGQRQKNEDEGRRSRSG